MSRLEPPLPPDFDPDKFDVLIVAALWGLLVAVVAGGLWVAVGQ